MDYPRCAHHIENLRILIESTPKIGDTSVKYLLADIYDLPSCRTGQLVA